MTVPVTVPIITMTLKVPVTVPVVTIFTITLKMTLNMDEDIYDDNDD